MGGAWIIAMISLLALVMSSFQEVSGWKVEEVRGWKGEEVEFFHVAGKVMCQDCSQGWNHWVHGATPLKGSKVAVTCMDARKRTVHHRSGDTDEHGEFDISVSKRMNGKEMKPEGCSVRLVSSSPEEACSVMTNFGGGKSGIKLYRPSHVYPGMLKYTVGPFYFTSPMCDEPDTSHSAKEGRGGGGGGGY